VLGLAAKLWSIAKHLYDRHKLDGDVQADTYPVPPLQSRARRPGGRMDGDMLVSCLVDRVLVRHADALNSWFVMQQGVNVRLNKRAVPS
jgi:hypothetical protein